MVTEAFINHSNLFEQDFLGTKNVYIRYTNFFKYLWYSWLSSSQVHKKLKRIHCLSYVWVHRSRDFLLTSNLLQLKSDKIISKIYIVKLFFKQGSPSNTLSVILLHLIFVGNRFFIHYSMKLYSLGSFWSECSALPMCYLASKLYCPI